MAAVKWFVYLCIYRKVLCSRVWGLFLPYMPANLVSS